MQVPDERDRYGEDTEVVEMLRLLRLAHWRRPPARVG